MAYLRVTDRCNMLCPHCCFAATPYGEDMSLETYAKAIEVVISRGDYVTIGGGEPTCNKHIIEMAQYASEQCRRGRMEGPALIITNGKLKTKAEKLVRMIERGAFLDLELSQDPWHDPIHHDTVWRFEQAKKCSYDNGYISIRSVKEIGPWGRAADPARGIPIWRYLKGSECVCDDLFIVPNGDVYSCGCLTHKLGSVHDEELDLSFYDREFAHYGGRKPEEMAA